MLTLSWMKFLFRPFIYITIIILVTLSLLLLQERKIFDIRTLAHINPIPHTKELIEKKKYLDADEYLTYFMKYAYVQNNPESKILLKEIRDKRDSFDYKKEKLIEGILDGKSDENIGKASALVSDFLFIGDIRDLSIEGSHYYNQGKVDKVVVALSSLGLIATVSTIYTLGATSPAKTSISFLKYAKKVNKIPNWLNKEIIKEAKVAKETKSLNSMKSLLEPIYKLYNKLGLEKSLMVLKKSKNIKNLNRLVKFTEKFGKESTTLLKVTKGSAFKYSKLMPNAKKKNILYASTYGENGLKGMRRMGEVKFMRRVGFNSALLKTTYKGNLNSLFNYLLKHIPTWLLFTTSLLGLFYFMKRFFVLAKRIF